MTIEKNGIATAEYISKDFLKKALENGLKASDVNIEKVVFSEGSSGGENYTSVILRALVSYRQSNSAPREISLVMKVITIHSVERQVLADLNVYDKEVNMYQNIIPRLENMLKDQVKLSPKFFYASENPVNIIVLEDLKSLGYTLADRLNGLDEDHSKVVLKKIAQFHAASMKLAKESPELVKAFNHGIFHEQLKNSKIMKTMFLDNLTHMISIVETWPGYESIAKKLKIIHQKFFDKCIEVTNPKEGDIRVLNHGDLWVNNFLFKYNNKEPCDIRFVDLQISFYSGLGIDINYFLNTSVQLDVLKTKRYELIRYYYQQFKSTLEDLKYSPVPSWEHVKNEIHSKEFYGFVSLEAVLPVIAMDRDASRDNSLEAMVDEETVKQKRDIMFSSKRLIETIKYSLDRFDELRVFD